MNYVYKAELLQVGIFFRSQFPSLGIFINKKLEIEKTKTTFIICISFKSYILGGLIFRNPTFFNKNSQGRKLTAK